MSLPSMRTMDSLSSQPGPPGAGPQAMSMGMPMAPVQPGVPFYGHHNMTLGSGYGLPSDPMARYALPHDPRLLARGSKKVGSAGSARKHLDEPLLIVVFLLGDQAQDEDGLPDVPKAQNQGELNFRSVILLPVSNASRRSMVLEKSLLGDAETK